MRLVVVGAAGMLGRDVVLAAEGLGHEVIGLGHAQLDVTDPDAVDAAIAAARPEAVVNCAAFTNVDDAEHREAAAAKVNAEGASHVASAAREAGAKVVYVSTDYVFDGRATSPYVEGDEPAPLSAYGRTKLAGEVATSSANPRSFVVRSAWLFGVGGPNFVDTMLRVAEEKGTATVVRDQVGSPTYTGHLAAAIMSLLEDEAYGVHHAAGRGSCSRYEFAREIFDRAGVTCELTPATSKTVRRSAPRPAFAPLLSERADGVTMPRWEEGLGIYLSERELPARRLQKSAK